MEPKTIYQLEVSNDFSVEHKWHFLTLKNAERFLEMLKATNERNGNILNEDYRIKKVLFYNE